jgi:spore germination cell wall hydrolase CwlJ-like protein
MTDTAIPQRETSELRHAGDSRLRPLLWFAPFAVLAAGLRLFPSAAEDASSSIDATSQSAIATALEKAGESFPGSAYFFAEDAFATAGPANRATDEQLPAEYRGNPHILAVDVGPAALPYHFAGQAPLDRARALACMTNAIYYEAGNEPVEGQRAVAQVVLNRLRHPEWPNSVCGVIYQGGERADLLCQFSFSCDGSMARVPHPQKWAQSRRVAEQALAGQVFQPAGLSTYYHTLAVRPAWASRLTPTAIIGAHIFYRMPGPTGTVAAFSDRYPGRETIAGPGPYAFAAPSKLPPIDPALLGPVPPASPLVAGMSVSTLPLGVTVIRPTVSIVQDRLPPGGSAPSLPGRVSPSAPATDRLPQSTIRPEFATSGRALP